MGITTAQVIKDEAGELVWQGVQNKDYYNTFFEQEYIRQTTEFYEGESKKWISNLSCPEFVKISLSSLKKEEDKVMNFLDKDTRPKLVMRLDEKIVKAYAERICGMDKTGVVEMLNNKQIQELFQLTTLLNRMPETLGFISDKLGPYIVERGMQISRDKDTSQDPIKYIKVLLELKKEMDNLMVASFLNIERFLKVNDSSFQKIMEDFNLCPKFLAEYNDYLMRIELKGKEAEAESMIDGVFGLFKLLKAKDAFTEWNKVILLNNIY
jgi:cullin 1